MTKAVIFDMYETLITHYRCPLYFSSQMAADAGIPENRFRAAWRATEQERTTGKLSLENVLELILQENHCYSETLLQSIAEKRIAVKEECFQHLHEEILPMLSALKERGLKIGLISNCFSEEASVIRRSVLMPYFDEVCLSYELCVKKPDEAIFKRCMDGLGVKAEECIYVGDGGSFELETARKLGMQAVQAVWYLKEWMAVEEMRKVEFEQAEKPMEVLTWIFN